MRSSFPVFRREIRQNIQAGLLTLDLNFFTTPSHFKKTVASTVKLINYSGGTVPDFNGIPILSKAPDVDM